MYFIHNIIFLFDILTCFCREMKEFFEICLMVIDVEFDRMNLIEWTTIRFSAIIIRRELQPLDVRTNLQTGLVGLVNQILLVKKKAYSNYYLITYSERF